MKLRTGVPCLPTLCGLDPLALSFACSCLVILSHWRRTLNSSRLGCLLVGCVWCLCLRRFATLLGCMDILSAFSPHTSEFCRLAHCTQDTNKSSWVMQCGSRNFRVVFLSKHKAMRGIWMLLFSAGSRPYACYHWVQRNCVDFLFLCDAFPMMHVSERFAKLPDKVPSSLLLLSSVETKRKLQFTT